MKAALIGSVSSSWHTLRGLVRGGVEVTGVLGLDESHEQRVSDFRSMRALAGEHGIPYCPFDKIAEPKAIEFLRAHPADLLFVVGLSQIAPAEVIETASAGAVGFHPTPLPRGRGRAPVVWTILLQEQAAANFFYLTDQADAGDIIMQHPVEVKTTDYAQDLIDRTNEALEKMVLELAPAIQDGTLPRTPQDHSRATWYGKRGPDDGRIDWSQSAEQIHRLIRAASRPYPGAFTHDGRERRIVWRAELHTDDDYRGTVGQVQRIDQKRGVLVQCGDGLLWLTEIESEGGEPVAPATFRVGSKLGMQPHRVISSLEARVAALEAQLNDTAERRTS
ncbi:MAG: methionyl-tRNA formyltransferase [Phycisphaerae bacterium]|nr:MAG: methionyl-tRNA formyltransferase [Phycisphaerae bacterium]